MLLDILYLDVNTRRSFFYENRTITYRARFLGSYTMVTTEIIPLNFRSFIL